MAGNENPPPPPKAPEPRSPGLDPEPGTPDQTDPREGQEQAPAPEREGATPEQTESPQVVLIDGAVTVEPVPDEPEPAPDPELDR